MLTIAKHETVDVFFFFLTLQIGTSDFPLRVKPNALCSTVLRAPPTRPFTYFSNGFAENKQVLTPEVWSEKVHALCLSPASQSEKDENLLDLVDSFLAHKARACSISKKNPAVLLFCSAANQNGFNYKTRSLRCSCSASVSASATRGRRSPPRF